jgi:Dinucleotide-utilizing enzymes involved in molybdopterin and thiamine biosynthesis family 2
MVVIISARYLVNASCVENNVALISASAIGFQGQLFMVEADAACYECLFPKEHMPVKVYAVQTRVYLQLHQMLWQVCKHIMPCSIWV